MLGATERTMERMKEKEESNRAYKMNRYAEIIGTCALELAHERSKKEHFAFIDLMRTLTTAIQDELNAISSEREKKEKDE